MIKYDSACQSKHSSTVAHAQVGNGKDMMDNAGLIMVLICIVFVRQLH